ncbi:PDZ domain-containing protein [Verrucomicrobia bacterium]|nr:PDZ domain-containing protein [Verrucomicrobiota bacterium]
MNDEKYGIKSNYNIAFERKFNVAIGLRFRDKPYREEKRSIIRLLESENAKKSGLLIGDEILLVDGKDPQDQSTLFEKNPGDKVKLTISRNGRQMDINVSLNNPPED